MTSLKFGTSGVRGLETELTDAECARFARAFVRHYRSKQEAGTCLVAGDLRASTPRIVDAICRGLSEEGVKVLDAGIIPTPALAFECAERALPGIMVTGSHIPADRNGIKFYFPWGEILKEDEAPILVRCQELQKEPQEKLGDSSLRQETRAAARERIPAEARFRDRYLSYFGPGALQGMRIAFYEHSSAAREIYPRVLEGLGAEVIRFGRTKEFIPVDTEALENVQQLAEQLRSHAADALISTDGDGDRPLLLDELGRVVRGDQLGVLAAIALQADSVSTPVSSSTALEACGKFPDIRRSKIGSPFVAAAMIEAMRQGRKRVIGYEANGGFLLGSELFSEKTGARLSALPTRDCVLPVLLALTEARSRGLRLSAWVDSLPARFTGSDLIRPFALDKSRAILERLLSGGLAFLTEEWRTRLGEARSIDSTDGVRATFARGEILHFRPSGNAPEFRVYSEAATEARAIEINAWAKAWIEKLAP